MKSNLFFSIIIPIYNRPDELDELLASIVKQKDSPPFEVIVVEDGSTVKCNSVIEKYQDQLTIQYFFKENSGPGDSRNYGMRKAQGDYFIILDSDTIVPQEYLKIVDNELNAHYVDAYGGPDMSDENFSVLQKAITYAMTSTLTTGGIRGKKKQVGKFQPRSFNMGISRKVFEKTGGFQPLRVGEDVDFSISLWENGFTTRLFENAKVYHKRRSTLSSFSKQVFQFGAARPIIFQRHPQYKSLMFWFPSVFLIGSILAFVIFISSFLFQSENLNWILKIPFQLWCIYLLANFIAATFQFKSIIVGALSVMTSLIQLCSYGAGFLLSMFKLNVLNLSPEKAFPSHFYLK
ncbi:MAG TPA: glycosyltransferase [Chitinophagales bacterium]|nr:glycosyltransferase [Chitinophagales bacterium]